MTQEQAAKDLSITQVPVIIREDLEDEDEQLRKLLATNFGRLKNNPVKQGRVYEQYEKLCGISVGRPNSDKLSELTQEDIARELGKGKMWTIREKMNTSNINSYRCVFLILSVAYICKDKKVY